MAPFFLEQAGFEVYLPKVRYRTSRTRATKTAPFFPGYIFVRIEQFWHGIRRLPGVIKPVMSGEKPAQRANECRNAVAATFASCEQFGSETVDQYFLPI